MSDGSVTSPSSLRKAFTFLTTTRKSQGWKEVFAHDVLDAYGARILMNRVPLLIEIIPPGEDYESVDRIPELFLPEFSKIIIQPESVTSGKKPSSGESGGIEVKGSGLHFLRGRSDAKELMDRGDWSLGTARVVDTVKNPDESAEANDAKEVEWSRVSTGSAERLLGQTKFMRSKREFSCGSRCGVYTQVLRCLHA